MTAYCAPQELHDLAFRYAQAVDGRDADRLLSVFTEDGAVMGFGENPISFRGDAGLRDMTEKLSAFRRTMHNVFNQTFEMCPDRQLTGETYCVASHILPGDTWRVMDMAIRYHNSYRQQAGSWRFYERRLEVLWVETRAVSPFMPSMMKEDLGDFV